jgi:KaiC/GvpD/RAD55 family RecA-like ATPase
MAETGRTPTGIAGLDDILGGGLPSNRFYLVQGEPGVGKTTLGLQFLLEGRTKPVDLGALQHAIAFRMPAEAQRD